MDKTHIVELLKYSSPYSILVVDKGNKLIELNCPFSVRAKQSFDSIEKEQEFDVSKVLLTEQLAIVYEIGGRKFYFHYFEILV